MGKEMDRKRDLRKPGAVSHESLRLARVLADFYGKRSTVEVYSNGLGSFPRSLMAYSPSDC